MNKQSIKLYEKRIENIQKEIKQSNEKIDLLERELTNIEQNITNKKDIIIKPQIISNITIAFFIFIYLLSSALIFRLSVDSFYPF